MGNVNPICMKEPILHAFGFTKLCLREFGGKSSAWGLDLDRTLADFPFMSIFAKYIFHEPSDISCHANSPDWISGGSRPTFHARLLHQKLIIRHKRQPRTAGSRQHVRLF
jgi:hypothetical protein